MEKWVGGRVGATNKSVRDFKIQYFHALKHFQNTLFPGKIHLSATISKPVPFPCPDQETYQSFK